MSTYKINRRAFLHSAVAAGAGSVLIAGLGVACQGTPNTAPATAAPAPAATSGAAPAAVAPPTAAAVAQAPAQTSGGRDINVVILAPLSGVIASDGNEMRNGVKMAVDEINGLGGLVGHKLKYIEVDDKDSLTADEVTTAFRRAIEVEKADVIFSGYHLLSGPEFDIVANAGTLYYNNNTQKAWTDRYQKDPAKNWSIFQTDPNEEWYGGGFARYLNSIVASGEFKPKNKTVAILHGDETYSTFIGNTFNDTIKQLGWNVVVKDTFTVGSVSDWGPLLSKVRDAKPDVFFSVDYNPAEDAAMIKSFVANPIPALVYQQYGPSVPEYLDLAGDAANGVVWATVLGYLPDKIGQDWVTAYKAKFNQTPGYANAPGGYDQVWVWATAAALAGDPFDYKKVAKMTEMGIHRGVTGASSFENHAGRCYPWQVNDPSLGQSHTIYQIQNKQQVLVFPTPYTNGKFQMPPWFK
jgi:branched-chain amino acid transport system substrate-binding protein